MKADSSLFLCSHCDKKFKYASEKRRHEQSHVPQFECKVCSKKFSFQSALRRHEKQHERTGAVKCNECGGSFKDQTLLKRHKQYAHKGEHKCPKCDAVLNSELALRTHSKIHKPESERRYRCRHQGCAKTFNFPHHLKHHELTHSNEKQYFCKHCGKGFIQSHHLKIHQRVHQPDSWLACPVVNCNKKFASEYALRRHDATHKNKTEVTMSTKVVNLSIHDVTVEEMMLCGNCNELVPQRVYNKHTENCIQEKEYSFETSLQNLQLSEDLANNKSLDEIENIKDKGRFPNKDNMELKVSSINDCKSALGGCIVTGGEEISNSCLCAQITTTAEETEEIFSEHDPPVTENNINLKLDERKCLEKRQRDANACDTCECASICRANKSNEIKHDVPEFEYRNDGIIKIRDTIDFDIIVKHDENLNKLIKQDENVSKGIKIQIDLLKSGISTCKDVLGKCIVSGNGTIGEGCLCIKMMADDQQMITQQIEDLTPCPKNTWLS